MRFGVLLACGADCRVYGIVDTLPLFWPPIYRFQISILYITIAIASIAVEFFAWSEDELSCIASRLPPTARNCCH